MKTKTHRNTNNKAVTGKSYLDQVRSGGSGLPSRVIMHAPEKTGKSSFAAYAPNPVYVMPADETGVWTLSDSGQIPEVPCFPLVREWDQLLTILEELREGKHDFRTLVIDTINGMERVCHEHVCRNEYGGEWSKQGFLSYMQGYEVSLSYWRAFLSSLDRLREERGMAILSLCHSHIRPFKNPEGPDYDRYAPALHEKTWNVTHRWADVILFANYHVSLDDSGTRTKAHGGTERIIYTERSAAFDAGNRLGLPPQISMGQSGEEAWANFATAVKNSKKKGTK